MNLLDEATDPKQYDNISDDWALEGSKSSPTRDMLWHYLKPKLDNINGKRILDVGCGTGWLSEYLFALGAGRVVGIDPAKSNIEIASREYPKLETVQSRFEDFDGNKTLFDIVVCILTTEHIRDLEGMFNKIRNFVSGNGKVIIVAADLKKFITPRFDYSLSVEKLKEGEYVVKTVRPQGVDTTDIVRSVRYFEVAALKANFKLESVDTIKPTEEYLKIKPWLRGHKNTSHFKLMVFSS